MISDKDDTQGLMGWGNRGWIDIVGMILEICERGALKTHVMYRCNLNSAQLNEYLDLLECNWLVEETPSEASKRTVYMVTKKGREYLGAYKKLQEIFR